MMSKVAVIFALLAFSAIATSPVAPAAVPAPVPTAGLNDMQQCLDDITQLVNLIPQIVNDIQSGDFTKIVADLTKLYNLVEKTVDDCSDSEVRKANGISQTCIDDISNALPIIQKTINDIAAGDFGAIFTDIMQLVSSFQKIVTDCTATTPKEFQRNDLPQCMNDIQELVKLIPQIVNDIQSGDFTKIIGDLTKLYNLIEKTVDECTDFGVLEANGISQTCIDDISKALPVIQRTINDIAAGDFGAILKDVVELVASFQKIVTDCTASIPAEFKRNDPSQCLNDIQELVTFIPQIINDIQSGDFSRLIGDLTKLYTLLDKAATDCLSHQEALEKYNISQDCLDDIKAAVPKIEKTINDIAAGDIVSVLADVMQLVSAFQKIVTDCTASSPLVQQ